MLLVDKPKGWTSFDVVAKVRGIISRSLKEDYRQAVAAGDNPEQPAKRFKVGHTGTLDPLATGLLALAVGKATKDIQVLTKLDKTYVVDARFGMTSSTGDAEGGLTELPAIEPPTKQAILDVLSQFEGEIMQKPPAYSAIKINGQRAYKLARAGKEVNIEARPVTIHSITDATYKWPTVRFTAAVSSGTYIRSLVEDIGSAIDSGAYMTDLRRTKVGQFDLQDAISISDETTVEDIRAALIDKNQ